MGHFRTSLLIDFSVASFLIMAALAVTISVVLTNRIERNVDLLQVNGATMRAGEIIKDEDPFSIPSLQSNVQGLRWVTIGAVGGGYVLLYGALVIIVWRGSRTIKIQQSAIEEHAAHQVEALNRLLQERINVLFDEVESALSEARANPAFGVLREYHDLVEGLTALVGPIHTNGSTQYVHRR